MSILCITGGCSNKQVRAAKTPAPPAPDPNSYLDLAPGSRLRIVVPLVKDGKGHLALGSDQSNGTTITVPAHDLAGYDVSYYSAVGQTNRKVHLTFVSAETTKDGQTVSDPVAPRLPFRLPEKTQFVRLVFLVRVSESDHNMAIIAADTRDALETFTRQVRQNARACQVTANSFCVWVPESIAVRPEPPSDLKK